MKQLRYFYAMALLALPFISCFASDTISRAGYYTLGYNVTNFNGSDNTTYIITTSNVILDLNSHMITGSTVGVSVAAGMTNVTVKNGTFANVVVGASVNAGCSNIAISNVRTTSCTTNFVAVGLFGTTTQFVSNVVIDNCFIDTSTVSTGGNVGRLCNIASCSSVLVRNCAVIGNKAADNASFYAGLALNSYNISFDGITISDNTGGIPAIAFINTCTGVIIKNCTFSNNTQTLLAPVAPQIFTPFVIFLGDQIFDIVIDNCSANNNAFVCAAGTGKNASHFILVGNGNGQNISITNCLFANNSFLRTFAYGVIIGTNYGATNSLYRNVVVRNVTVANNSSTIAQGVFNPFAVTVGGTTASTSCQLLNCEALNNSCDYGNTGTAISGFFFTGITNCSLIDCVSINNTSTAGVAIGFEILNSGTCLLSHCNAAYNKGISDVKSFGFNASGLSNCAFIKNIAIRNGVNIPVTANQFVTGVNAVPAGSVKSAAFTALNTLILEFSNFAIT